MGDQAMVSARAVLPIVAAMRAAGADAEGAVSASGLDLDVVLDPDARVLHERVVRLWTLAVDMTGDPDFGLKVSDMVQPGDLGVLEYGFRKSATVREGLERVERYMRINHDVARFATSLEEGRLVFEHRLPGGRTLPRAPVDFILSNPAKVIADATNGAARPVEVWVDYAPPDDVTALKERFGEIRFLRGRRALVFDASVADVPLRQSEPGLCAILDQHARQMLEALPTAGTFADRVRELLAAELCGGDPTSQAMARLLKMSVRTLHRRLSDEGTSHKQLLEQLRRELAETYLRERDVSISEAAYLLGFSEPSAFHRAFRRWTGQTPAEFRAAGAAG